jgi:xanthine dehydrogenase iron-sulfur cluster and FAD-binding subunit A
MAHESDGITTMLDDDFSHVSRVAICGMLRSWKRSYLLTLEPLSARNPFSNQTAKCSDSMIDYPTLADCNQSNKFRYLLAAQLLQGFFNERRLHDHLRCDGRRNQLLVFFDLQQDVDAFQRHAAVAAVGIDDHIVRFAR